MHGICNDVVCATSKDSDQPAHMRSLIRALASRLNIMSLELLTEHRLEFLSLNGGCTGSSESSLVKIPHRWKSRVTAHLSTSTVFVKQMRGKMILASVLSAATFQN